MINKFETAQQFRVTTTDTELAQTKDYQTVMTQINLLYNSGVVARGSGFCLSMSEMIRTLLVQQGISSRLVECKLTVMSKNPPRLSLIGHDNLTGNTINDIRQMDVHVVCITDTEIPMLIDLSIAELRPEHTPYICERAPSLESPAIAEYQWSDTTWVYQTKPVSQLPKMHQESIVDRFLTDRKIFRTLRTMTILLAIALVIGTGNAVRGAYDFYQVYIDETNYWGPKHLKELHDKIDQLDRAVKAK
jgi:hypothetical protein